MVKSNQTIEKLETALNQIADECQCIEPYLESAEQITHDVERLSSSLLKVDKYTNELNKVIKVLSDICYALSFIPVVGTVVSKIPDVLKMAKKITNEVDVIIKDGQPALNGVKASTHSLSNLCANLKKTTNFADSNFRNYVNSLHMLGLCLDVLNAINHMIQKEQTKNRFQSIIDDIETKSQDLATDLSKIQSKISKVRNDIENINNSIQKVSNPVLQEIENISSVCKSITRYFTPITNAFNKIIDAIAPIKWLLKAFSWVFNKIINPIVNKIMGWLGLDKLIATIKEKIATALHIDLIKNALSKIENNIGQDVIKQIEKQLNDIEVQLQQQYEVIDSLVSLDYFEKDLLQFLSDSYEEFEKQELPDFPVDSILDINIYIKSYSPTKIFIPLKDSKEYYLSMLDNHFIDDYSTVVKDSIKEVNELVEYINDIYDRYKNIDNQLILCKKYNQDIMMYHSLFDNLKDCLELFNNLHYFDNLTKLICKIDHKIDQKNDCIINIHENMQKCYEYYTGLYQHLMEIYQSLPDQNEINELYRCLMNIEDSYKTSISLVENSLVEDKRLIFNIIDDRLNNLFEKVNQFNLQLNQLKAQMINKFDLINEIQEQISNLSNNENEIIDSKYFIKLSEANQRLLATHSIVLPVKQLIEFILEKDESQVKDFLMMLNKPVEAVASKIDMIIDNSVFDSILNDLLPVNNLNNQIIDLITKIQQLDITEIETLVLDIKNIKNNLKPTIEYKNDDGDIIMNFYIDQTLKDALTKAKMESDI